MLRFMYLQVVFHRPCKRLHGGEELGARGFVIQRELLPRVMHLIIAERILIRLTQEQDLGRVGADILHKQDLIGILQDLVVVQLVIKLLVHHRHQVIKQVLLLEGVAVALVDLIGYRAPLVGKDGVGLGGGHPAVDIHGRVDIAIAVLICAEGGGALIKLTDLYPDAVRAPRVGDGMDGWRAGKILGGKIKGIFARSGTYGEIAVARGLAVHIRTLYHQLDGLAVQHQLKAEETVKEGCICAEVRKDGGAARGIALIEFGHKGRIPRGVVQEGEKVIPVRGKLPAKAEIHDRSDREAHSIRAKGVDRVKNACGLWRNPVLMIKGGGRIRKLILRHNGDTRGAAEQVVIGIREVGKVADAAIPIGDIAGVLHRDLIGDAPSSCGVDGRVEIRRRGIARRRIDDLLGRHDLHIHNKEPLGRRPDQNRPTVLKLLRDGGIAKRENETGKEEKKRK